MDGDGKILYLAQKEKPLLLSRADFIPRTWKVLRRFFYAHRDELEVVSAREREGYFLPRVFAGTAILLSSLPTPPDTRSVVTTGSLFLLEPELPIFSLDASLAWFPEVSSMGRSIMQIYSDRSRFSRDDLPPDAPRAFALLALNHPEIFDGEEKWTPHILHCFLRMLQRDHDALDVLIHERCSWQFEEVHMKQYLDPIQPDGLSPGYDGLDSLPRFQAETTPPERNSNKGPEALLVRLRSSLLDARLASDIVKIVQLERMIGLLCRRHGLS